MKQFLFLTYNETSYATDARAPSFHSSHAGWHQRVRVTSPFLSLLSLLSLQTPVKNLKTLNHPANHLSVPSQNHHLMSSRITFAPPPWVTSLLLRSPTPIPPQPRAPPSAMRDLVAQWLVYVTDDVTTPIRHPPHVIARFRGWLAAFVFRIPGFVRPPPSVEQSNILHTAQFSVSQRSVYFSSSINTHTSNTVHPPSTTNPQNNPNKNRPNIVEPPINHVPDVKLSPLYKSLYFSSAASGDQSDSIPPKCEYPLSSQDIREPHCVHSFFLTDASGEGKGILEGLKEIKAHAAEPQRKRGWVPAVVSLILIALNPLKG